MSRSKHQQRTGVKMWNPPPLTTRIESPFDHTQNVQSATECTGLVQQPVMNQSEGLNLSSLYAIHDLKPQGNVGKDNPNNDPFEIEFHRGHKA